MADTEPVVVLKSGAFRVDIEKLRQYLGAETVRQATPDEVRESTGQAIGGVSPVGWPQPLRCFIDDSLEGLDQVWAACGTPNDVFCTSFMELQSLTGATALSMRPI
jgi:prolyl-tRNA editing enzyme YbaK/EbsC (Cys-tRNA(Pro) deacylase)